ncbi:emp24p/erv25p- protein [Tilletia horrida]|uniref:Emp24p/erv25p- protein n=1 Tax=Tilletia horrida TaxID=155126 RepID=A0AAN6GT45_9BASI|nr:emp24p/erv25p- protein [Tilletia horrida]KAK0555401.1 emp24p/erv25p- protein [Tilletia horrida]KAK0568792.1 emp24p/erv25p- protein [Tilletia horrida]
MFAAARLQATALLALLFALQLISVQGLYFYMEGGDEKCFIEELPNDTVVVGHYFAEEWDSTAKEFKISDEFKVKILVTEKRNDHIVTSTLGHPEGKFAFTSHEAGDHQICLSTTYPANHGAPTVRMHLDIIIGDAKPDSAGADRVHVNDLAARVRELNARLRDIRREQQFQREREAEFRNLSELTNSRAMWWSVLQLLMLGLTCAWQLTHLKTFFSNKKLH